MDETQRSDQIREFELLHEDHDVSTKYWPDFASIVMTCHDCGAMLELPLAQLATTANEV
ncbi:MAG: hypothetical protein WA208_16715 [Thermoanaerobaculia bacterium]